MRALKLAGLAAGALIALVALAAIALSIFIDPNDYRSDIERLAKQRTGRDLQIGGKIGLKLFPWVALQVHDVILGNPRGYSTAEPFASINAADIGVKLLPLLRNRVEVRQVSLDGLQANLVSRGADDNNWKDFGDKKPETPAESGSPAGTFSAKVAGVDIAHAGVSFRDEEKHTLSRVSNLEAHLGEIGGDTLVKTKVALDYETEKGPLGHFELDALLKIAQPGRLEARDLKLQALLKKATRPVPLAISIPALVLDTRTQTLTETRIDVSYDGIPVHLTAAGAQLFGERDVHGTLSLPDTRAVPKPLTHLAASASYQLGRNEARLSSLDVRLDDSHITGSAAIEDLDRLAMRFALAVDRIDLDHYLPPSKPTADRSPAGLSPEAGARAPAQAAPPTRLPIDMLRTLFVRGTLQIGQAKVHGLSLMELSLPIDAAGGLVRLDPTAAKLYGGNYDGKLQLDARPAVALLALEQHLHNVDLGAVTQALFRTDRIIGHGDADARLTSSGNTDAALIAGLTGKIQMNVREGAYNGLDLWYEIRAARALLGGRLPPARSGPARTAFKALGASAVLDHGVARNDDLKADADYLKITGKGTVNLITKALDYKLTTQLTEIPPGGAGAELTDLRSVQIPVTLTGTLDQMKVRPDLQGLLKSRLQNEVKKRLGDKLKGLFGQ